jgi:hypothetical protein
MAGANATLNTKSLGERTAAMIGTHATMGNGLAKDAHRWLIERPVQAVRAYMERKASEELALLDCTDYDRRRAADAGRVAREIALSPDRSVRTI